MIGPRHISIFLALAACTASPQEEQPPPTPPEAFLPESAGSCPGFVDGDGCSWDGFSLICTFSPAGIEPRPVRIWYDDARESAEALVFYWHGLGGQARIALRDLGEGTIGAIVDAGGIVAAPEADRVASAVAPFHSPWLAFLGQREPVDDFLVMDEVVACAMERLGVDPRRIHSTGLSAGGIQTAQVGLRRSGYIASIAIFSGFRAGNPIVQDPDNAYPVLLAHGGAADEWAFHLTPAAQIMHALYDREGHSSLMCDHGQGHVVPAGGGALAWRFFEHHPYGTFPSPYEVRLPVEVPHYCEVRDPVYCGLDCMPPRDWSCLGSATWPTPSEPTAVVPIRMESWRNGEPVSGVRLDLCATDDTDCATPIVTSTTETDGEATVTVPLGATGFDGYVRWTKQGWAPGMGFLKSPPIASNPAEVLVYPLETQDDYDSRWAYAGLDAGDPERGDASVRLLDCAGNTAAGVVVTLEPADSQTGRYYARDGPLDLPAEVPYSTEDGWAVFMNVPPGPVTATAVTVDTEEVVGTVDFLVAAGHHAYATIVPSPGE